MGYNYSILLLINLCMCGGLWGDRGFIFLFLKILNLLNLVLYWKIKFIIWILFIYRNNFLICECYMVF